MVDQFDRSRLIFKSIKTRKNLVFSSENKKGRGGVPKNNIDFGPVIHWLKNRPGPRVWFLGGHVFKANVDWYLNNLRLYMDHVATNGAGLVHYYEKMITGATSESVAENIRNGTYGMWEETANINEIMSANNGCGIGETFLALCDSTSVHTAVGQDIFCMYPNYDPEIWGQAAYIDFLRFASVVEAMQGGTLLVFGSAVCAPEVFLKALAMARNANNGKPDDLAIAVFDCVAPPKRLEDRYFHRPSKTLIDRITDNSVFIHGRHEITIPSIWKELYGYGHK